MNHAIVDIENKYWKAKIQVPPHPTLIWTHQIKLKTFKKKTFNLKQFNFNFQICFQAQCYFFIIRQGIFETTLRWNNASIS